jgi:hypothetical protein
LSSYLVGNDPVRYIDYEVDATEIIDSYNALGTGKQIAYIRFSTCNNNSSYPPVKVTRNNILIPANYRIDKLSASINAKVDDLSAKSDTKNALYGKTYLTFGDSYTEASFTDWVDENGLSGKNSP